MSHQVDRLAPLMPGPKQENPSLQVCSPQLKAPSHCGECCCHFSVSSEVHPVAYLAKWVESILGVSDHDVQQQIKKSATEQALLVSSKLGHVAPLRMESCIDTNNTNNNTQMESETSGPLDLSPLKKAGLAVKMYYYHKDTRSYSGEHCTSPKG